MDEQRSLLDSLMGLDRDVCGDARDKRSGESFKDAKVCKSFLVGFCPNELFKNTKRELGPCPYLHNEHVLAEFEAHPDMDDLSRRYERDLKRFLEAIVGEADRWIEREKRNQRKPIPDVEDLLSADDKEQIEKLNAAAQDLISRSAKDVEEGNFAMAEQKTAHAMQAKQSAEVLKERRRQAYVKREEGGTICEICGIRSETGNEDEDRGPTIVGGYYKRAPPPHEDGRVHRGYITVRAKIKELEEKEARRKSREQRGGARRRSRSRKSRTERTERREEKVEKVEKVEDKGEALPTMDGGGEGDEGAEHKEEVKKEADVARRSHSRSRDRRRSRSRKERSRSRKKRSRSRRRRSRSKKDRSRRERSRRR
eukprot:GEMP01044266.1.p1 GENE.GEMP01044266.1~~GEMP01044266.1.p1  ORF type:complete len:411 (+),score=120.93 GEMP01044266.1:131-1234(+)